MPDTTVTLTDAEVRAVLYACSVAAARLELWHGNFAHQMAAVAGREKIATAYAVAEEASRSEHDKAKRR